MYRNDLDLEAILNRLNARGLGPATAPFVEEAIVSHVRERGDETMEFEDLLLGLTQIGKKNVAFLLLEEAGVWLGELPKAEEQLAQEWRENGCPPYKAGYGEARQRALRSAVRRPSAQPYGLSGAGLDERIIEYPWIFDRLPHLHRRGARSLDAGSTLNHPDVLDEWRRCGFGPLSIVTLRHEGRDSLSDDIRYEFADLRELPYRDGWFSTALCISTLEHVGMDTTLYGADGSRNADPEAEAIRALHELARVLEPGGTLLVTVPCGEPRDLGWLRVVGTDEVQRFCELPLWASASVRFFRALPHGWREVTADRVGDATYNGFPGRGEPRPGPDWVAAAEAVACLEMKVR